MAVLEQQQKSKDKKSHFKRDWLMPVFEGFIGSLGIIVALIVTLVAWLISLSKKEEF